MKMKKYTAVDAYCCPEEPGRGLDDRERTMHSEFTDLKVKIACRS